MDTTAFVDRLLPGERILWAGRPSTGILFTPRDVFLVPFSLLWCGFAIFWEATVAVFDVHLSRSSDSGSQAAMPGFFLLFGGVFVCVGLYFVFGRFAVDAWLRNSTRYAVTDRRILIARSGPLGAFMTLSLDRLPDVRLREGAGGRGTIQFGHQVSMFGNRGFGSWSPALDPTPQFLAIEGVRDVFNIIQRQANRADQ